MRFVYVTSTLAGLAVIAIAGFGLAQTNLRTSEPGTKFRRAAIVELPVTQKARSDLAVARLRPQATTLRASLARTATARVDLRAIDRGRVPVLIASRPALVSTLRVFPGSDSFSASAREGGVSVVIDGTRSAVAAPATFRLPAAGLRPPTAAAARTPGAVSTRMARSDARIAGETAFRPATDRIRPMPTRDQPPPPTTPGDLENVVIEQTEYGVDVSFVRFGAAYNVSVACDEPQRDPDCSPAGAEKLVRQMEIIGGGETR